MLEPFKPFERLKRLKLPGLFFTLKLFKHSSIQTAFFIDNTGYYSLYQNIAAV